LQAFPLGSKLKRVKPDSLPRAMDAWQALRTRPTPDACIGALIPGVHSATEGMSRPNFLKFLTLRIIGPRLPDVTSNHATVAMPS